MRRLKQSIFDCVKICNRKPTPATEIMRSHYAPQQWRAQPSIQINGNYLSSSKRSRVMVMAGARSAIQRISLCMRKCRARGQKLQLITACDMHISPFASRSPLQRTENKSRVEHFAFSRAGEGQRSSFALMWRRKVQSS